MNRLLLPATVLAAVVACFAMWGITARPAAAQAPPESPPRVEAAAPGDTPESSPAGDRSLREQTIYIPFARLRETFEKEGRGVFLTYEQFQALWRQARQAQAVPAPPRPPVGAVITEIESDAAIEPDVVVVTARLKVEVIGAGWHQVPLRLSDAAIRSARIGTETARITFDPQSGYKLLWRSESDAPQALELLLEYVKAFEKSPGLNRVRFAAPQAPINQWRIRIPQRGVKISVQPFLAATEEPAGDTDPGEKPPTGTEVVEATTVRAFVGAAPEVRLEWTPKAEGARGLEALAAVQAQQEIRLDEGVLRTRCRLSYEISRAELTRLTVAVPPDQRVTAVFDPNVRQWDIATDAGQQTVTIQLFEPAKAMQSVTIEMEQFGGTLAMGEVRIPAVKALGVGRQQGTLVVRLGDELRAEPIRQSGLLQLDTAELPPELRATPWSFAFRYAAVPYELVLQVEKVKPRIRAEELVEWFLEPEQATLAWRILFDIQEAGVFQLELEVPPGYLVRHARGEAAAGAEPAVVDSFTLEGENRTRLRINLARKALGRVGLAVELFRRLEDENLASPTGRSSSLAWPLPRTAMGLEHSQGRLLLYAPESLRITPEARAGTRIIPFAEALQGFESQRRDRFPALREVLAFVCTLDPVDLSLSVERRKPQVDARQLLTARVEAGVVKYESTFTFDVRYSSVKSVRIDIPTALAGEIRNVSQGIRERVVEPRPADAADSYTPWSFTGEREFLGTVVVKLMWEEKRPELTVGRSDEIPIPVLRPRDVDRSWGQIAIVKAETLDVNARPGFTGLRPIDPQHDLSGGERIPDVARAFEYHEDWSLTVVATRYQLEDVKRTSIERGVVRMVVTRSGHVSVQALYRVRSAVQRLLVSMPPDRQFDSEPVRINGRAVPPERGDSDQEVFVPLTHQDATQPFVLELRYTIPGGHRQLDLPHFPPQPPIQSEPAVQKIYLVPYLPDEVSLLGSRGPWTSEQVTLFKPRSWDVQDPRGLVNWVIEGTSLPSHPFDSFPTDGRWHVFSTLHPEPPPAGSLRLVAADDRWLNLALFGSLAVLGLIFSGRPVRSMLGALAVLIAALVLAGVFLPTFAQRVLDAKLVAAVLLILFLWLVSAARRALRQPRPSGGRPGETPFGPAARQPPGPAPATSASESSAPSEPPRPESGTPPGSAAEHDPGVEPHE